MKHRNSHTYWKEEQRKIRSMAFAIPKGMVLHESLHSEYIKGNTYEGIYHVEAYSSHWSGFAGHMGKIGAMVIIDAIKLGKFVKECS